MKLRTRLMSLFSLTALGAIGVATLLAESNNKEKKLHLELDSTPINRTGTTGPRSYAPMLEQAQDTVVSVYTAEIIRVVRRSRSSEDEILRRFFGIPSPRRNYEPEVKERLIPQGVGSGVIVREDGYIVTNSHVVSNQRGEEADEVLVRLNDGRELPAKIIGRDPRTDIAVLKVEATELPTAKIADSTQIKVGDIVFAIGNPMGVGLTVTSGIVSATGRQIGIYGKGGYENFIQTDASINPGNSGGALVDIEGRLIGINSAILSHTGTNAGIGFAIPSNLTVNITDQLTGFGQVRRGLLGVRTEDVSHEIAKKFGLENVRGALVLEVVSGLPADKAGLKQGDIIVSIDNEEIENSNSLRLNVSQRAPESTIKITAIRQEKEKDFTLTLADQSDQLRSLRRKLP